MAYIMFYFLLMTLTTFMQVGNSKYYNYFLSVNATLEEHKDDYEKDYFTDYLVSILLNVVCFSQ